MPVGSGFFPRPPAVYRDAQFQFVFFSAQREAVSMLLPDPLEASDDCECLAVGMNVPFSTSYGPFQEAFLLLKCHFGEQTGWFWSHVFSNGPAGIAAGREIYGTPKVYADISAQ